MNVNNNSNLGIVVECIENSFDENQSLLLNSSQQVKRKLSDRLIDSNKQDRNNLSSMTSTDSTTTSKCNNIDEDDTKQLNISNIKIKKKSQQQSQQQPSRLERSRLGLITFLNNITAAPTNSDLDNTSEELFRKNTRSHSITSSSANSNNIIKLPEQYKNINKSTKSLCTKLSIIEQQQNNQRETYEISLKQDEALSVCDVPLTTTINNNNKIENCGYGYKEESDNTNNNTNNQGSGGSGGGHCDKLSIKSGISVAASSNSGPSESLFSGGSAHSNISGIKSCFKQKECPICCIRQPTQNFYRLKACTHIFCKACLVKYLGIEIAESRTDISCPECPICLQISDIYNLLSHQPEMLERFEFYSLRRVLSIDPDTRWCPAPDCTYAVIANSCAACPQLKCERCTTSFCYHCKSYWHPNQTCDQAKSKSFFNSPLVNNIRSSFASNNSESSDEMKACPRCGALITKMNDGSCNHMQCALCNAEFCWLCLKQINELHYLSPTGCTFWGKKPWTRKKKLLWQIGTLIGAPLGIALIAGLAVPGIICGVPIFIGRKTYQRFSTLSRTKRQLATALSVVGSLIISPVLAVMTVGVGVPIMLAYVYGVVPLSLCRNGACGGGSGSGGGGNGSSTNDRNINSTFRDEEGAYGERILISDGGEKSKNNTSSIKTTKSSFHQRRQSIASFGLVSLTDKPNTEDASIQAIAGSQYNYDNRSVHTIWSNGQYGGHVIESVHGINIYNAEDAENAENASTMACCSASIAAQASERRSLTGSNSSFKTRPRSSISNSRGVSEEPGKIPTKFTRKISSKNIECGLISKEIGGGGGGRLEVLPIQSTSINDLPGTSTITNISVSQQQQKKKSRFSIRSFVRHPINTVIGKRKSFNAIDGGKD